MNHSANSGDHDIKVEFTDRHMTFSDQVDEQPDQANVPLLLQRSHARSKSSMCDELRHFRITLKCCALDHSSFTGKFISYIIFVTLVFIVPVIASLATRVPATAPVEDPLSFNKMVHLPESGLAAIAFFMLSRFFQRYSLRQLLFLDGILDDSLYVRQGYKKELDKAFKCLAYMLLPSFFVELAHKIIYFSTVTISMPYLSPGLPLNSVMFLSVLASWLYRTGVFLLVCVLFRLTCELQILRFEGLYNMLDGFGSEAGVIFEEHLRIRKQLWVTSHRYRFFIIGCLVTITVSQLGALLLVLASKSEKTFFNSGDLVVCSAVELSGFLLCILGAARITHRAQRIVSVATKWHMLVTRASTSASDHRNIDRNLNFANNECDSDSSETYMITNCSADPSSFQTRQALGEKKKGKKKLEE